MSGRLCWATVLVTSWTLAGCQSPSALTLKPLSPEFERVEKGGARYLILVNTSEQELHHCRFTAYLSDQNDPNPLLRLQPFARCTGHKDIWSPGEEARFRCMHSPTTQFSIVQALTRVEVVGHCDEGSFHQSFQITESDDEVRPPGVQAVFSPYPVTGDADEVSPPGTKTRFMPYPLTEAEADPAIEKP